MSQQLEQVKALIQLREKEASAKEIIELAKTIRQLCYETDVIFIIN